MCGTDYAPRKQWINQIPLQYCFKHMEFFSVQNFQFQIKETVESIRPKRKKIKTQIETIIFPFEKIPQSLRFEQTKGNHIILPRIGQRHFVSCFQLPYSNKQYAYVGPFQACCLLEFWAHCVFILCLLINCQSSANFWMIVCVLFIVLLKKKSNYSICHREMVSSGSNDEINELFLYAKKSGNKGNGERKKESSHVYVTFAHIYGMSEEKADCTRDFALAHRDTCRFRRIWWMNHNEIDCFTMQTLTSKTEPATHKG